MAANLRQLLLQRSARLQGRPAITAPEWGTLSWSAWRNRVDGVALGLMVSEPPSLAPQGSSPWAWAAEVAAACAGIPLDPAGLPPDPDLFGGSRFNTQEGRQPYHDREDALSAATPFDARLTQGDLMLKLQRWNRKLGWDHDTVIPILLADLASGPTREGARATLWNLLYAGGHAVLLEAQPTAPRGLANLFTRASASRNSTLADFTTFWE